MIWFEDLMGLFSKVEKRAPTDDWPLSIKGAQARTTRREIVCENAVLARYVNYGVPSWLMSLKARASLLGYRLVLRIRPV